MFHSLFNTVITFYQFLYEVYELCFTVCLIQLLLFTSSCMKSMSYVSQFVYYSYYFLPVLVWSLWVVFSNNKPHFFKTNNLNSIHFRFWVFLTHLAKGHASLPSLGIRRPSASVRPSVVRRKLSDLNLLLWNPWTELILQLSIAALV